VQFAQQSYSHLADLELADHPTEDCGSEVDLLIGNDFYWSFFTGDMKRGGIRTRGDENESWMGVVWTHALRT